MSGVRALTVGPDPLTEFGSYAFEAIRTLQRDLKETQEKLEEVEREYALLKARCEAMP